MSFVRPRLTNSISRLSRSSFKESGDVNTCNYAVKRNVAPAPTSVSQSHWKKPNRDAERMARRSICLTFSCAKTFRHLTPSAAIQVAPGFDDVTKTRPAKAFVGTREKDRCRNHFGPTASRHIGAVINTYRMSISKRRQTRVDAEGSSIGSIRTARAANRPYKYSDVD